MTPIDKASGTARARRGQSIIFLIVVLLALSFVAIWNFDLHKIFYVKALSQNAGDSAALAAARWQGLSLNLVGDLNIMQAVALMNNDTNAAGQIAELQARLLFVGPMVAMMGAQQAAKNNHIAANDKFSAALFTHATRVENDYPMAIGPAGTPLFPEPWPGAWSEYADMLYYLAEQGIAAAPDNARFFNDYASDDHYLLTPLFYEAVFGSVWCWFYHNAYALLTDYTSYLWWEPLPPFQPRSEPINSEFFGLGLTRFSILNDLPTIAALDQLRTERKLSDTPIDDTIATIPATWYAYAGDSWAGWSVMQGTVSNMPPLPLTGTLKPQYNYTGADAVARIESQADRLTPGAAPHGITWSAAAKPFGYLNEADLPTAFHIVLPAFRDVRLIPLSASSGSAEGSYNILWRIHIEEHLPRYMEQGLSGLDDTCWYCAQLRRWENPEFRRRGIAWIDKNSNTCLQVSGGGGGGSPGGGTQIAH